MKKIIKLSIIVFSFQLVLLLNPSSIYAHREVKKDNYVFKITDFIKATMGNNRMIYNQETDDSSTSLFSYRLNDSDIGVEGATITKYNGDASYVKVPEEIDGNKVVKIDSGAFEGANIEKIDLPDSIVKIGDRAFANTSLASLTLPSELVTIGKDILNGNSNLKEIIIPKTLCNNNSKIENLFTNSTIEKVIFENGSTSIPDYICSKMTSLKKVEIPDTVTRIGTLSFANSGIEKIDLPDSVTSIEFAAFNNTPFLTSVNLPSKLTEVGSAILGGNTLIKEITIPQSLCNNNTSWYRPFSASAIETVVFEDGAITIPQNICEGMSNLKNVKIPDTVTSIGWGAFSGSGIEKIDIPGSVTSISSNAFSYTSLTSLTLPTNLTKLESGILEGNTSVKKIIIPKTLCNNNSIINNPFCDSAIEEVVFEDGVTTIPDYTCQNMNCLKKVQIPVTVTSIGTNSFAYTSLTSFTLPGNLKESGSGILEGNTLIKEIIIPKTICIDKSNLSSLFSGSSIETVIFEDGSTSIPSHICGYMDNLKKVEIPDTVKSIGQGAFAGSSIESIEIPDSVTSLGIYAFHNCKSLKTVMLSSNDNYIGMGTFKNCTALETIELPSSVKGIGFEAFYNCSNLQSVKWSKSLTEISKNAFSKCDSLNDLVIPDSVTTLGESAFYDCDNLKNVTFGKGMTFISQSAFEDCDLLESIEIPDNITTIGLYAFKNCDSLDNLVIPDTVTSLGQGAFYDCDNLKNITFGTGVTNITKSLFEQCDSLENVEIPYGVTSINSGAFVGCNQLSSVTIPRSVTNINSGAFSSFSENLTIYGASGSDAETYAKRYRIEFVALDIKAEKINLSKSEIRLANGKSERLILSVLPTNFTDEVTWKTGNIDIVTVGKDGKIIAQGVGDTFIKVIVGEMTETCKVTVYQPVTSVSLNKTSAELDTLEEIQLSATVYPKNAENKDVEWSSSDTNIATVDNTGKVKALKKGTAYIIVKAKDGSDKSNSCKVTVNDAFICKELSELESAHNYTNKISDCWSYSVENANSLDITFDERTEVEDGFDYIYIYDKDNKEVGKYTGKELAGQTIYIKGNSFKIRLKSDDAGNGWGFKVTDVQIGKEGFIDNDDGSKSYYENSKLIKGWITVNNKKYYADENGIICTNQVTINCIQYTFNDSGELIASKEDKSSHQYELIDSKEATCTEDGYKTYKCSVCKDTYTDKLKVLGHEFDDWKELDDNYHSRTCQVCNEEEKEKHKWNSGKITKQPTTTSTGTKVYTCTVCKATKEVTLKKLDETGILDVETAPTLTQTTKAVAKLSDNSDPKDSKFNILQAQAKKIGNTSVTLKWTKVKGAKSYTIYGNLCGTKYKYIKLFDINNGNTTTKVINKINKTKMKKGTFYKFIIVANSKDSIGNTKTIATSKSIHIVTTGNKKKANFKNVTVSKAKATVKVNKIYTIKGKQIAPKGKKVKQHRKLCFESSNPSIATVTNKGKVTGKKKGKAIIYVYSQNGLFKKVTITVN